MKCCIFLICIFPVFLVHPVHAQDAVYHPIDKEKWEKAVDGLDYTEQVEKPKDEEEPQAPEESAPFSISADWMKIVVFGAVAALLIFILIRLFGKGLFNNPKLKPLAVTTVNDLEERPMESDLEQYLREAVEAKNYKLAIRIYFLMLLKTLQDKELITWKKDKTNFDYLLEVANHPHFHQLSNSTLIFEYVWYGDAPVGETQFNRLSSSFTGLIENITGTK